MSAFLCDEKIFNQVASSLDFYSKDGQYNYANTTYALDWYTSRPKDKATAESLAHDLYQLNLQALDARYGDPEKWDYGYKFSPAAHYPTLTGLYKALGCLIYQCSEGNVPDMPLFKNIESVENALARDIVSNTAEYQAEPWG